MAGTVGAPAASFIKAGQTYFNVNQISQVVTKGDGTAWLYYNGGGHLVLNLGVNEAAAITALNTLLTPTDVTTLLV